MPRLNFKSIPDSDGNYEALPAGTYPCVVKEVKEGTSKQGNEKYDLVLRVTSGEFENRQIWDHLVFTDKSLPRVKLVCGRLGLDTESEDFHLTPESLVGRQALVTVKCEPYQQKDGSMRNKNIVPFDGYKRIEGAEVINIARDEATKAAVNDFNAAADDDQIPF